jgi:diketogulonate reductase-like aldo/keto reductase
METMQSEGKVTDNIASSIPAVMLRNGRYIPQVGLGVWKIPNEVTANVVVEAIRSGVRHIDCAAHYGNEKEVGEGIADAIKQGLVKREDLFVTSKLWNTCHNRVEYALDRTLADLRLQYVDLYLIHFPFALKFVPFEDQYPPNWVRDPKDTKNCHVELDRVPIQTTWRMMEDMVTQGKAHAIGLSNFTVALIRDVLSYAKFLPSVLQVELHPYLTQETLIQFCRDEGIHVFAYSPLGVGSYAEIGLADKKDDVLNDPVIYEIAQKQRKSAQQIILRWALQRGTGVIFKSCQEKHIKQNLEIVAFDLSSEEMKRISNLNKNLRFNDPAVFGPKAFNTFIPLFD